MRNADVVCATCIGASMVNKRFSYVVIDECQQGLEPECLIPLMKGAQKVVLAGDIHSLNPIVSEHAKGLRMSLFH